MKAINFLMAGIFVLSLCLAPLHGDAIAKSATEDTATKSTKTSKTTKTEKAKSTKKTVKESAPTEIPKNVNINSADKDTLALLPGIGPAKAEEIIKYRKQNGKFKSIDDLTKVKGIGDKTLKKLKPYLKKV